MSFLDELDSKIVKFLMADGRVPNTEIARQIGVAEATVRKRIDRLRQEGIIRVAAVADPLKIGYQIWVFIEFRVSPAHVNRVSEELARMPEIFFLGITTGACDLIATALFRSTAHMDEFFTQSLARIPGLDRTSTFHIIRVVKREFAYPMAEPNAQARPLGA